MFLQVRPSEARVPETLVLPDDRKRLTRFFILAHRGVLPPDLDLPWGTADFETNPPAGWEGLRLTARQMTDEIPPGTKDSHPIVMMIYEQIDATAETAVGGPKTTQLEDGREASVDETIQFSSAPYVPRVVGSVNPDDADEYLLREEADDNGTTRTIRRTYVTAGTIATDEQIKNGGSLSIKTITSVKTVPSTPSGYTLIGKPVQNPNGLPIYTYTYAKGEGVVSESIDARPEGLRVQTYVSLGTKATPDGVVIRDDFDERDGYRQYTVSSMQAADGGDPTTQTFTTQEYRSFLYPGRALAYSVEIEVLSSVATMIDVYQSPPIEAKLEHNVVVSYSSSGDLTISNFWSPDEWATLIVSMVTRYGEPLSIVKGLPGYRSMSDSPISYEASITPDPGESGSILGNLVYGGTTGTLTVLGGPVDPGGSTYTVDAHAEPAFLGVDGVQYYRITKVTVAVPNQPSLPSF